MANIKKLEQELESVNNHLTLLRGEFVKETAFIIVVNNMLCYNVKSYPKVPKKKFRT